MFCIHYSLVCIRISIVFIDEGLDEVAVLYVVIDDEELDTYDSNDFINYVLYEHENQ